MQRRMKAKIFCLSFALENPHQALDAYMSFVTATARKISCSESSHNPCLRRTRSAYRVCLCTGRYDALYVQRYRQTTGKCDAKCVCACVLATRVSHASRLNRPWHCWEQTRAGQRSQVLDGVCLRRKRHVWGATYMRHPLHNGLTKSWRPPWPRTGGNQ